MSLKFQGAPIKLHIMTCVCVCVCILVLPPAGYLPRGSAFLPCFDLARGTVTRRKNIPLPPGYVGDGAVFYGKVFKS